MARLAFVRLGRDDSFVKIHLRLYCTFFKPFKNRELNWIGHGVRCTMPGLVSYVV